MRTWRGRRQIQARSFHACEGGSEMHSSRTRRLIGAMVAISLIMSGMLLLTATPASAKKRNPCTYGIVSGPTSGGYFVCSDANSINQWNFNGGGYRNQSWTGHVQLQYPGGSKNSSGGSHAPFAYVWTSTGCHGAGDYTVIVWQRNPNGTFTNVAQTTYHYSTSPC